ncbi:MAG: L-serine ammonia-lyase, iron-sulfur-dependent subunit beta [Tissierellia bacterium]|nr:L-serine ammonia-lyase, iron-sulfur-dependent subunit beta [Tissierellia bacterium]
MASNLSVFDIVGPIMVGPSSSHTAGANRIAGFARKIGGKDPLRVDFFLHGSFEKTYKGHGTDKALLGGVLGFSPEDERIKEAFRYADEKNLEYSFIPMDLGDVHPNTVKIVLTYKDHRTSIIGCSIGGGNIKIISINGNEVEYYGKNPTIVMSYYEQKGMIAFISNVLFDGGYNIHTMQTINKGEKIMLIVELDEKIDQKTLKTMQEGKDYLFFKYLD